MDLRPYQLRAVDELLALRSERPVLAMPTGAGKTVVMCEVIRRSTGRVLLVAHRRELVTQARDRLAAHGIRAGLILAGESRACLPIQVASIQTLMRRVVPPADMLIIDEAHHAVGPSYQQLVLRHLDGWVWGATATPFRLDGKGLGSIFSRIVCPVRTKELCEQGVLVAPVVYAPPAPDLRGIKTVAGDFAQDALGERMGALVGNSVEHWLRITPGRRTIAFAVNVQHSMLLCKRFQDAGVRAAHLDGSDSVATRDAVLQALAAGAIDVLCNCMILGEGWDLPSLEVAILARPTKSRALHLQQIGRIMRAAPGKAGAVVLDHAGNHHRHGGALDHIEYSLDDKKKHDSQPAPFKTCKACYAIVPLGATECPECGADLAGTVGVPVEEEGELVPLEVVDRGAVYRDLVRKASSRNYRMGWARFQFKNRFGTWPRGMKEIEELYVCPEHEIEVKPWPVGTRCARCLRSIQTPRDPGWTRRAD